jgi:hypothetical protein
METFTRVKRQICKASDCTNTFEPSTNGRTKEYCCTRCRYRERGRKLRKIRMIQGLCTQCGGEMDSPVSPHKNKVSPKYCSKCQGYFHNRYEGNKAVQ